MNESVVICVNEKVLLLLLLFLPHFFYFIYGVYIYIYTKHQGDSGIMTSISDGQIIFALISASVTSILAVRLGFALYR